MTDPTDPAAPIEVSTRYATTVDDLPAAWAFVMAHIDHPALGPDPSIGICPVWFHTPHPAGDGDCTSVRRFEVVVDGMVEADYGIKDGSS